MNPRIQVEHTVTEEITDVDLVQSQMRIASGETLADLGSVAGRRPDQRRRAPVPHHHRGPGERLPSRHRHASPRTAPPAARASVSTAARPTSGVEISAHFDSMLVKLTCRGRTYDRRRRARARRALAEFRIRGVSTNIPFLQAVLEDPDFIAGDVSTAFIEERPELLDHARARPTAAPSCCAGSPRSRSTGPTARRRRTSTRREKRPTDVDLNRAVAARLAPAPARARPGGLRGRSAHADPRRGHRHHVPRRAPVAARDPGAHQGPAAASPRTWARMTPELFSVECWGGATYDVALRFLDEDPWERLAALRYNMPGRRAADAAPRSQHGRLHAVPDQGRRRRSSPRRPTTGIDIFRIFDALNDVEQMRPAIDAVLRDRHHRRRGRALLHRRPERTRREDALHPRLLPAPGRASRRGRGAHPGDQGHGRAAAPAGGEEARHRAARALRPARSTCTRTTPPAASSRP